MVTKEVWSMSETPLPTARATLSADTSEERTEGEHARLRRRASGADKRPVPTRSSIPPRIEPAFTSGLLSEEDVAFVNALRSAGLAQELTGDELVRAAQHVQASEPTVRRLELLIAYYEAADDPLAAQRRRATDRWFLYRAEDTLNASQLLAQVLNVVPELAETELERVGGPNGTLVLRAGDDVCALEDEREDEPGLATVSVCDLVRAINILLDRRLVRARLVGLIGDGKREAYLGLPSVTAAIALSSADYLAVVDAEALLDLTGW